MSSRRGPGSCLVDRRLFYLPKTIQPCVGWNKFDVMSFLAARKIPLPPSSGRSATGVGLSTPALLWLHDAYPDDFEKVCGVFPFARAAIYRREWFGVE